MKQKKLIIFMPSIEGGGVEKNLFIISNYLVHKIKDISLITISNSFKHKFNKKIRFISLKKSFWNKIGRRKKFFLSLILLFFEILKNKNILVLCFQGNIYCTFLCKLLGVKIIVRSNSAPDGWSQNFIKYLCFKYIFKLADKIIVNSYEFKKRFKDRFNLQTECIYNPLNKNEILIKSKKKNSIRFDNKKLNIISVGRFTDQKDQITLLKALNIIKEKLNFRLLLVGRGQEESALRNYIKKNNLGDKIKIVKFTENPYNLIKSSDLFILTSIYEGLPNVLLEAITLKKFVISSNCPTGPKEILMNGKAGYLFTPGDYKQLAKLIVYFKQKKTLLNKKINFAYSNLDRFDHIKNLQKYFKTIERLLY